MKRLPLFAIILSLVLSCNPQESELGTLTFSSSTDPYVTVMNNGNAQVSLPEMGGSASLSFIATADWSSLTSVGCWFDISPTQGHAGTETFVITSGKNDTGAKRTATLTLSCGNDSKTVTVNQGARVPSLKLSGSQMEFDAEGAKKIVDVLSNMEWTVESDAQWCSVSPSKGEGNATLVVEAPPYTGRTLRETSVTVKGAEGLSAVLTVTQNGVDFFEVNPTEVEVGADGGEFSISVESSSKYSISVIPDWISKVSDTGNTLTFKASANGSTEARSAEIVFVNGKKEELRTHIKQAGSPPRLSVSAEQSAVDCDRSTSTISVSSNTSWTVSSDQPWCVCSPASSKGDASVELSFDENTNASARTAVVTVRAAEGGLAQSVSFTQAASEALTFDWTQEFFHRSYLFHATATWCGYCPTMDRSIEFSHEKYPDKFISVSIHGNGSKFEFRDYKAINGQFQIKGYPTGCIDMRRIIENYFSDYYSQLVGKYIQEQEKNYPVVSTIALNSSLSGRALTADVKMFIKQPGKYKVTVYVTESGIIDYQADNDFGSSNTYRHDDVVRFSMTHSQGDAFEVSSPNTRLKRSYSANIPTNYNKDNLKILVLVQREFGSQTRLQDGAFGDYYVDNCIYGKVGVYSPPAVVSSNGGGNENVTDGNPVNW